MLTRAALERVVDWDGDLLDGAFDGRFGVLTKESSVVGRGTSHWVCGVDDGLQLDSYGQRWSKDGHGGYNVQVAVSGNNVRFDCTLRIGPPDDASQGVEWTPIFCSGVVHGVPFESHSELLGHLELVVDEDRDRARLHAVLTIDGGITAFVINSGLQLDRSLLRSVCPGY